MYTHKYSHIYIYINLISLPMLPKLGASGPLLRHPSEPGGCHPAAARHPLVGAPTGNRPGTGCGKASSRNSSKKQHFLMNIGEY